MYGGPCLLDQKRIYIYSFVLALWHFISKLPKEQEHENICVIWWLHPLMYMVVLCVFNDERRRWFIPFFYCHPLLFFFFFFISNVFTFFVFLFRGELLLLLLWRLMTWTNSSIISLQEIIKITYSESMMRRPAILWWYFASFVYRQILFNMLYNCYRYYNFWWLDYY